MLIEKGLKFFDWNIGLIHQHVIVSWPSCTLNCHVRAEIDVVLERMSHIVLNQGTRHRVSILVSSQSRGWEETDMVTLLSDNNCHLRLSNTLAISTKLYCVLVHTILRGSPWPISSMRFLISATS